MRIRSNMFVLASALALVLSTAYAREPVQLVRPPSGVVGVEAARGNGRGDVARWAEDDERRGRFVRGPLHERATELRVGAHGGDDGRIEIGHGTGGARKGRRAPLKGGRA